MLVLVVTVFLARIPGTGGSVSLLIAILIWFYYFLNDPVFAFMYAFTIFLNIALFFTDNSFGLPQTFKYKYLFLLLSFSVSYSPRLKSIFVQKSERLNRMITYIILLIVYQILVTIMFQMELNIVGSLIQVYKRFLQLFGILIFIPAYKIFVYDSKKVFNVVFIISGVVLFLFFLSIFTNINLIRIEQEERIVGTGMLRMYFQSWGYIALVIPSAVVLLLIKFNFQFIRYLLIVSILAFAAYMLTISRLSIIALTGQIVVIYFLVRKYYNIKIS